jgi:hypothetical protein
MSTLLSEQTLNGKCFCGCGELAPISKKTNNRLGYIKGRPLRYIHNHHGRSSIPWQERFWALVDKSGGPEACWPWKSSVYKNEYAHFETDEGQYGAHRIAWAIANGAIPEDLWVLHKCDTPACVNPGHLWLGTRQDNIDDMIKKGRQNRGTSNGSAKLTEDLVRSIRAEYAAGGVTQSELAVKYGVSSVQHIISGKHWSHVEDSLPREARVFETTVERDAYFGYQRSTQDVVNACEDYVSNFVGAK